MAPRPKILAYSYFVGSKGREGFRKLTRVRTTFNKFLERKGTRLEYIVQVKSDGKERAIFFWSTDQQFWEATNDVKAGAYYAKRKRELPPYHEKRWRETKRRVLRKRNVQGSIIVDQWGDPH